MTVHLVLDCASKCVFVWTAVSCESGRHLVCCCTSFSSWLAIVALMCDLDMAMAAYCIQNRSE